MLSEVVKALISPVGTALLFGMMALLLGLATGGSVLRRLQVPCALFALAWLGIWSTPLASEALRGWIEDQAGPRTIAAVPRAPAIVVLGGGVQGAAPPRRPDPDLRLAADRVWHAARLYHAGKARRIVLSGGNGTVEMSEALAMRQFLEALGVPRSAMLLEEGSSTTRENAAHVAAWLRGDGIREIILVTSALHMPRARAAFEAEGLKVHPAPTDFEVIDMPFGINRVLPDTRALDGSYRAFKEVVARWL